MLRILTAAALIFAATCAQASEKKEEKQEVGQYVDLSPVAIPIVVRGSLVNYVFVYVRINLTGAANSVKLREKEPFFRDALVRVSHRTPFTKPGDYMVVDEPRLRAAMMREAAAIAGPDMVKSVVVTSQTPKMRIAPPRPPTSATRS